ncbi:MAG TPA: adenylate kinase [Candidatus Acidoferrales bacterium]
MAATAPRIRPLVFLGAPGAGKGTQARAVAEHLGVPQISTGDMFRDHAARGTELGKQAKVVMERGELVSDNLVVGMVAERIARPDCAAGFILDGFPRTVPQAERLETLLAETGRPGVLAVNFRIGYTDLVRRLTGRRTCVLCGEIYNIHFRPPKVEGRCDRDGGELKQRADDREEVIRERLNAYERQTQPLVDFYRERGALLDVDAEAAPEELTRRLLELLEAAVAR